MEVAIPETFEQDETRQMSQHGSVGSLIDVDSERAFRTTVLQGQLYERPAGDENMENGAGSLTESPLA
jgi:hypothetical protein